MLINILKTKNMYKVLHKVLRANALKIVIYKNLGELKEN